MEKGGDRALQGGFCFTRDGKSLEKTACSAGGPALTPGLGRAPGEGNGNSLQYFWWEIPLTEECGRLQPIGSQRGSHD